MYVARTVQELRSFLDAHSSKSIGFVPTMGALHDGHFYLIEQANAACDLTVVSIFVNRAQFAPHEDFDRYPRMSDLDLASCERLGVAVVFMPDESTIYPDGVSFSTRVYVPLLGKMWDGASRRHYFRGICMVVNRLLNLVRPTHLFMGEKDFQQLQIIRRMVKDLFIPTEVVGVPTVRAKNGLALSSRNNYLSEDQCSAASVINSAMKNAVCEFQSGETSADKLLALVKKEISEIIQVEFDYCAIINPTTLRRVSVVKPGVRLIIALVFEGVRLIDNIAIDYGNI